MSTEKSTSLALAAALVLCLNVAAEQPGGIAVTGRASRSARPDTAVIVAVVQGQGETATKALAAFRKTRQAVLQALGGMELENLSVGGKGVKLHSHTPSKQMAVIMGGGGAAPAKVKTQVMATESLELTLRGIDKAKAKALTDTLARIVDTLAKAGANLSGGGQENIFTMQRGSSSQLVTFKLSKLEALERKAAELAMANARAQAERLAKLGGVALGSVRAVRDVGPPQSPKQVNNMVQLWGMAQQADKAPLGSSFTLAPIKVEVALQVVYRIKP